MKKGDIILISVLLTICIVLLLLSFSGGKSDRGEAVISVDGNVIESLSLDEDAVYTVQNEFGTNIITIQDGYVSITWADCPDASCTRCKAIGRAGECIVCLPHRLSVTILSADSETDIDAVTK